MSWLRSAVNMGAGSVIQDAGVAVPDGVSGPHYGSVVQSYKSGKQAVKQLEELAVSCRGWERVQILKRWLKGIENLSGDLQDEGHHAGLFPDGSISSPIYAPSVLYFDPDMGGEPMNFRGLFLQSQALEGIALSMILEAPNKEEVPLLLKIFGVCFIGGHVAHNALISSIQQLASAFSSYEDEVLVKHEELLQYVQAAISGLKSNPKLDRLDIEASALWKDINQIEGLHNASTANNEIIPEVTALATTEAVENVLAEVKLCSMLESLLLKRKLLNNRDSMEAVSENINKLKIIAQSLVKSSSNAGTRISDQRHQIEEALSFREAKTNEISDTEMEISKEISELEKHKEELEAQLRQVQNSLKDSHARLNKTREEKGQFEEASNQIVNHLKSKEDELSRSFASYKFEAGTIDAWIKFLENTLVIQSSFAAEKEKQIEGELEKFGNASMRLIRHHLQASKEELRSSVDCLKTILDNFKIFNNRSEIMQHADNEMPAESNPRKLLEMEYLKAERKVITAFSLVDHIRELFYVERENTRREETPEMKMLLYSIEGMRHEFGSLERPLLEMETAEPKIGSRARSHGSVGMRVHSNGGNENGEVHWDEQEVNERRDESSGIN